MRYEEIIIGEIYKLTGREEYNWVDLTGEIISYGWNGNRAPKVRPGSDILLIARKRTTDAPNWHGIRGTIFELLHHNQHPTGHYVCYTNHSKITYAEDVEYSERAAELQALKAKHQRLVERQNKLKTELKELDNKLLEAQRRISTLSRYDSDEEALADSIKTRFGVDVAPEEITKMIKQVGIRI